MLKTLERESLGTHHRSTYLHLHIYIYIFADVFIILPCKLLHTSLRYRSKCIIEIAISPPVLVNYLILLHIKGAACTICFGLFALYYSSHRYISTSFIFLHYVLLKEHWIFLLPWFVFITNHYIWITTSIHFFFSFYYVLDLLRLRVSQSI